jgi:hypothetical protein
VRRLGAIDELQLERHADLLENEVDDEAGVAGSVVQLDHGRGVGVTGKGAILASSG